MATMSLVLRPDSVFVFAAEPDPPPLSVLLLSVEWLVEAGFADVALVGFELATTPELLPLPSAEPVATGAMPDTNAVVVAVGCGLSSAALHENIADFASNILVPAANEIHLSSNGDGPAFSVGNWHATSE